MVEPSRSLVAGGDGQADADGVRICPSCGAADRIDSGGPLWPTDWRCPSCSAAITTAGGIVSLAPELDSTTEGYDIAAYDLLAEVEAQHFWFVARNRLIHWLATCYAAKARRVLEIGCGTGFVLCGLRDALPRAQMAGSELHSAGLLHARARLGSNAELFQMDARRGGLVAALDLIGAFDVLEHIPDDEAALLEIATMLRPGGTLLVTVPQHPWLWSVADDLAAHQRRYRRGELAAKVRAVGLTPVYSSSFVTLPFPMMAIARIFNRFRSTPRTLEEQLQAEFRLSPWLNDALLMMLTIEQALRRRGMPLPFGGSQVVVARKPAV